MFDIRHGSGWMSGIKESAPPTRLIVIIIGHSTYPVKEFIQLLKAHQVQRLVDVRMVPRSRHNPQFNRRELSPALHSACLHYRYMPGLGGFRRARRDSLNTSWHNTNFRGNSPVTCRHLRRLRVGTGCFRYDRHVPIHFQGLSFGVPPLVRFRRRVVHYFSARWPAAIKPDGESVTEAHHPDPSFGMGLCQLPSEAIITSASFGPQLRRL